MKRDNNMRIQLALVGLFGLMLFGGSAFAADGEAPAASKGLLPIPDYSGDLWTRSYLAGDFNAGRTALANKGITLDVDWTQYAQSIVDGGNESSSHYGGHLDYLAHIDLMRMGLLPGALVVIRAESRYGQSANGDAGPILPVNTAGFFPLTDHLDDGVAITVTDLTYFQFLSEQLGIFAGKLDTLDGDPNEFASGRGKSQFMDANFVFNSTLALRLPYSTLGGGVLWMPTKNISIKNTIFNTVDSSTTSGFEAFGHGVSWSGEADVQYRLGNLPGGSNIGGLYSWAQDFAKISGDLIFRPGQGLIIPKSGDTWAVYASTWQYLYVKDPDDKPINVEDGKPDHQGIGVFGRIGFADQDTNPIEWSGSVGIGGRGMIPSRKDDVFGLGYYYTSLQSGRLTRLVGVADHAQGAEAFYNIALTPAAHLTFDIEVEDPALPHVDTAVILGMRLDIAF